MTISPQHVHRPLSLTTPRMRGADVKAIQQALNRDFDHLEINRGVTVDGVLGKETWNAIHQAGISVGLVRGNRKALERHTLTESAQRLLRGSRTATFWERRARAHRSSYRKRLRRRYAGPPASLMLKAEGLIGVHEQPPGSNWGGKVEQTGAAARPAGCW
jgi:hypothetical protein